MERKRKRGKSKGNRLTQASRVREIQHTDGWTDGQMVGWLDECVIEKSNEQVFRVDVTTNNGNSSSKRSENQILQNGKEKKTQFFNSQHNLFHRTD